METANGVVTTTLSSMLFAGGLLMFVVFMPRSGQMIITDKILHIQR